MSKRATSSSKSSSAKKSTGDVVLKLDVVPKGIGKSKKETLIGSIKDDGWRNVLAPVFASPNFDRVCDALQYADDSGHEVFPPQEEIFNAFNYTPFDQVKVVILGQDPYHDNNQAHGVCFSVKPGIAVPPSLRNIYTELESDIAGFKTPKHGYLEKWCRNEGILMLNATLTVRAHNANSHAQIGWLAFTNSVLNILATQREKLVFVNWGKFAQDTCKKAGVAAPRHFLVEGAHPSPLSVTKFRGCKHFSKVNEHLRSCGKTPIDWSLPENV